MASLMETIIDVLNREDEYYHQLIELSMDKSPIIIKGDLEGLAKITEEEQIIVAKIQKCEKLRMQTMKDIGNVTNHDDNEMKLSDLIEMMATRPEERKQLTDVHDRLRETLKNMRKVNEQNRELLKNSLEMVEFELNLVQSLKQAPATGDYNRNAYSTGAIMGSGTKSFDAKQ